uniref:Uncharacterized protein n=1 Tax=Timema douglasi TaxID=61478 RepID=A0A7R8VM05_TIMDO|nr:unnamed protein product [Timema douglasi]
MRLDNLENLFVNRMLRVLHCFAFYGTVTGYKYTAISLDSRRLGYLAAASCWRREREARSLGGRKKSKSGGSEGETSVLRAARERRPRHSEWRGEAGRGDLDTQNGAVRQIEGGEVTSALRTARERRPRHSERRGEAGRGGIGDLDTQNGAVRQKEGGEVTSALRTARCCTTTPQTHNSSADYWPWMKQRLPDQCPQPVHSGRHKSKFHSRGTKTGVRRRQTEVTPTVSTTPPINKTPFGVNKQPTVYRPSGSSKRPSQENEYHPVSTRRPTNNNYNEPLITTRPRPQEEFEWITEQPLSIQRYSDATLDPLPSINTPSPPLKEYRPREPLPNDSWKTTPRSPSTRRPQNTRPETDLKPTDVTFKNIYFYISYVKFSNIITIDKDGNVMTHYGR